jgi:hypothetical protein
MVCVCVCVCLCTGDSQQTRGCGGNRGWGVGLRTSKLKSPLSASSSTRARLAGCMSAGREEGRGVRTVRDIL